MVRSPNEKNSRVIAIDILHRVIDEKQPADQLIDRVVDQLSDADRRFVHQIVYGVLRTYHYLDADISRFLRGKTKPWLRMALLVGGYQIRCMRTPQHAAVHETVDVVKKSPFRHASGMVNAILRNMIRQGEVEDLIDYQRYELPEWIYKRWLHTFGHEQVKSIAEHISTPPPLTLSVMCDRNIWVDRAKSENFTVTTSSLSPYAVHLPTGSPVTDLPGYDAGEFIVMDQAAQMVVEALPETSGTILDMCAAPGGKTAMLARHHPKAMIMAMDISEKRIHRLRQNIERMRCQRVQVFQADGCHIPLVDHSVESLLLDAPCTASGIFRRHPDAKFLHTADDVRRHAAIQSELLIEAIRVIKPGGIIVYAVCSIHQEENENVLQPLIDKGLVKVSPLPDSLKEFSIHDGMARIFPGKNHDGFFIACLNPCFS
ncbi:MAG: 16S rRNA (cytosine(967)-C(5))-methyltransferase RsmB [Mariprofundaceae bacterium]